MARPSRQLICAGIGLYLLCVPVAALDLSRLWLPKKYRAFYPKLLVTAETVIADGRCPMLLEGTLDLEQSGHDRPVFRLLCRREGEPSFNLMVDGLTRQTLNMESRIEALLTYEQKLARQQRAEVLALERQRREEERRRREEEQRRLAEQEAERAALEAKRQREEALRKACEQALLLQTAGMIKVEWVSGWPLVAQDIAEASAAFFAHFNAEDPFGRELHYQAHCIARLEGPAEVDIRSRR